MNLGCGVCIQILIEQYIWKCNFFTSIAMKMPILKLKCQVVSVWSPMKRVCAGSLNSDSACNDQIMCRFVIICDLYTFLPVQEPWKAVHGYCRQQHWGFFLITIFRLIVDKSFVLSVKVRKRGGKERKCTVNEIDSPDKAKW